MKGKARRHDPEPTRRAHLPSAAAPVGAPGARASAGAGSRTLAESNAVWGEVFDVLADGHAHTRTCRVALTGFATTFLPFSL
jgi:hypothetical protein